MRLKALFRFILVSPLNAVPSVVEVDWSDESEMEPYLLLEKLHH